MKLHLLLAGIWIPRGGMDYASEQKSEGEVVTNTLQKVKIESLMVMESDSDGGKKVAGIGKSDAFDE